MDSKRVLSKLMFLLGHPIREAEFDLYSEAYTKKADGLIAQLKDHGLCIMPLVADDGMIVAGDKASGPYDETRCTKFYAAMVKDYQERESK